MTALLEYQRLEATGIWFAEPGAQRQDVILSLGDASLTIYDHRMHPLTHWSLAALHRINPGRRPAIYAAAADAPERLEVEDETMVKAIERIRKAVEKGRPHPGRLRGRLVIAGLVALLAIVVFWLPGAILRYTAAIAPEGTRASVSAELMERIERVAGLACTTPNGSQALRALATRLAPDGQTRLVVLRGGVLETTHLPDGTILLNRAVVEDYEVPEAAAGFVLQEIERREMGDPFLELLQATGLGATLRLMTQGRMPTEALDAYAERLLTDVPPPVTDGALLRRFGSAGVPSTPFAFARDISGETTSALIEGDPMQGAAAEPVLSDGDWVALQGICGE